MKQDSALNPKATLESQAAVAGQARGHVESSRALRVLHVGKFYPPHMGGIETHLQSLCTELRTSLDLRVIVSSDDRSASEASPDGFPVYRVPTLFSFASTPVCPGMVARIRQFDSEI